MLDWVREQPREAVQRNGSRLVTGHVAAHEGGTSQAEICLNDGRVVTIDSSTDVAYGVGEGAEVFVLLDATGEPVDWFIFY